ncbi:MAG TPA: CoA ester lyase [Hyphomicrobiaceae bacterium]|nr:CoA ester lyase [Hyphomicrobiaceae bacterium]
MLNDTRELPVWRSMLFVPVNVPKFVERAHERGADAIILDLEDSIPPAEKANARALVREAAPRVARNGADVVVRINRPLDLAVRDIEAAVMPGVAALMLPKVESASHVQLLAELVASVEAARGVPVGQTKFLALIETPSAFEQAAEIARADPRLVALSLGSEDFALEIGGAADPEVLTYPKQRVAIAAIAAGLMPMGVIGSVADYSDREGYKAAVLRSRRFGFRGSSCIHPALVPILNDGFTPSAVDLEHARRVIAADDKARAEGRGSAELDGRMIDVPIVVKACRLIAMAEKIAARAKRG